MTLALFSPESFFLLESGLVSGQNLDMKMRSILSSIPKLPNRVSGAVCVLLLAAGMFPQVASAEQGVYQSTESFLAEVFGAAVPEARALWLRSGLREAVAHVLGHDPALRVRYWQEGTKTVWVLDEIGKDQPITAGVVVEDAAIGDMRVLAFRESRGWEIRYPFFTRQFNRAWLTPDGNLDRDIDGITGATLSVRAMTKMARVALLLDARARGSASENSASDLVATAR